MRLLDRASIPYDVVTYDVDENDLSGIHVAHQIGMDADAVFKTLVLQGERTGHLVCCLPVSCELDLKKVARASGDKRVEMIPMKTLFEVTGYIRGGCSPLGMKKEFPTYIDESALLFERIGVSAGVRGEQILCNPDALITLIGACTADLIRTDL